VREIIKEFETVSNDKMRVSFDLDAEDDDWKEKVIARAEQVRKRKLITP